MSIETAFAAMYAAAEAIRCEPGIESVTVENDSKTGEIAFTVTNGKSYWLLLREIPDEE